MEKEKNISKLLEEAWKERGKSNYGKARKLVNEAHTLCVKDDYENLGRVFHIYMQFESDHENYSIAQEFCQKSLDFYTKTNNLNLIAHSTRHLADLQQHLGQNFESKKNYHRALEIYQSNPNTNPGDLANAFRGFGLLLEKLGKKEATIEVWKKVKELYHAVNLQAGVDEANAKLDSFQL